MKGSVLKKVLSGIVSAALFFSLTCVPAFAQEAKTDAASRTVTVSGTGNATVTPDTATITFSVSSRAETAVEAQSENTEKTNAVLEALKALELDEKDIKTSSYNIYPEYNYDDNGNASIAAYNASTELTVSGQTIEMAGTVLSAGVSAGINVVSDVSFSSSTYDDAYNEALAQAVKRAQAKAEAIAAASGDTLGKVTSITEGYEDISLRSYKSNSVYAEAAMADSTSGVNLTPGETEITANITVVYELSD